MVSDTKKATYEDLLALSEDVGAEVLNAVVTVSPSPLPRHSAVQGALSRRRHATA